MLIWFVLMASAWPLLRLEELTGNPFVHLLETRDLPLAESARWQLLVLVPAAVGLVLLWVRMEVMGSGLGWLLPGIKRQWLTGELLVAVPVALGAAVLTGIDRGVMLPLAAAGAALVAWNLPGVILHPCTPGTWRYVAIAMLVAGAVLPAQLGLAAGAAPGLVAGMMLTAGGLLFALRHGDRAAREGAIWGSHAIWESGFGARFGAKGEWGLSLATDRPAPWLWAIFYEGAFGSLRRIAWMRLARAGFLVVMTYAFLDRYMLIMWLGMVAGDINLGPLRTGLLYPLSRDQRARLLARAALLDAGITCVLLVGGTLLLEALPLPFEPGRFSDRDAPGLGLITAVAVALLPIAMFGAVRSTARISSLRGVGTKWVVDSWLLILAFVLLASMVVRPVHSAWSTGSHALILGGLGLTAALLYAGFWYGTLRHYRREDLAGAAG
ncbi:MAG: hypothetical protein ABR551_09280 [Gemmatimonadales bacterium]